MPSCTKWSIHFLNMHVAYVNGHCKGINSESWLFSDVLMLPKKISLSIVEHGMDLFMEGWHPCLHTHNIFKMIELCWWWWWWIYWKWRRDNWYWWDLHYKWKWVYYGWCWRIQWESKIICNNGKSPSSLAFYNARNHQIIQARRGTTLWPCHFTHESFGIRYLEHSPHKVEWIITSRLGPSTCGRWVKEFS